VPSRPDLYYYAEPIRFGDRLMAALVDREGSGEVDLIARDPRPKGHPSFSYATAVCCCV
jgi:hypothetical protein